MGANDHKFIYESDIVNILKDGNSHHQIERNLIKQSWYQDIDFQQYFDKKTLTHTVWDTLEFIFTNWISKSLEQDDTKDISMQRTGSNIAKIEKAYSLVNTDIAQALIGSWLDIVFTHLNEYSGIKTLVGLDEDPVISDEFIDKEEHDEIEDEKL